MTLLLAVLVASALGSLHCAAMCGAFVCAASRGQGRALREQSAYHAGRLVSYVTLGALAGAIGATMDDLGALAGVARGAAVVAGVLMVLWALSVILSERGIRMTGGLGGLRMTAERALGSVIVRVRDRSGTVRAGALGLVTTLLPCGWLYAFVVTAGSTGRPLDGALVMLAFWAGTVPALAALGAGAARLVGPAARRLPLVTAMVMLALGLLTIAGRLHPPRMPSAHAEAAHAGR